MAASILGWVVAGAGNAWSQKFLNFDMSKQESKNTFDGLVSVTDVYMEGGVLSRIPSIRKMRSLKVLSLDYNKITAVEPGDFAGAAQLVVLWQATRSFLLQRKLSEIWLYIVSNLQSSARQTRMGHNRTKMHTALVRAFMADTRCLCLLPNIVGCACTLIGPLDAAPPPF